MNDKLNEIKRIIGRIPISLLDEVEMTVDRVYVGGGYYTKTYYGIKIDKEWLEKHFTNCSVGVVTHKNVLALCEYALDERCKFTDIVDIEGEIRSDQNLYKEFIEYISQKLNRIELDWNTLRIIKTIDNYTLYLIKEPLFIEKEQKNDETVYYVHYDTYTITIKQKQDSVDYVIDILL